MRSTLLEVVLRAALGALGVWTLVLAASLVAAAHAPARPAPADHARAVTVARGAARALSVPPAPAEAAADAEGAIPVLVVDAGIGHVVELRGGTVADVLADRGLVLRAEDRLTPDPGTPLAPGLTIRIVRVEERERHAAEAVAAPIIFRQDPAVDAGTSTVIQPGRDGLALRSYLDRIEDGRRVSSELVAEDLVEDPVPALVAVGTRPIALDTPQGRLYYARTLTVLATYYTPANGGKAPGSPAYGITATGARATRGIVAVDPRVIPLYSWLYVPGYGVAQARDVGGAIIGDHIDVAFDDGDGSWWGRRVLTVYLLAGTGG